MRDRFDFLEIGDAPPVPLPELADPEPQGSVGIGWKPLRLRPVEVIGEPGSRPCQFASPTSLASDRDGAIYVVDSNNHRVQRIALNGDVLVYGRPGDGPGQLWGPQAVAVHPGGQFFFVAEQGNHRLQWFHFNGRPGGILPGFRSPSGLAFDTQGYLWVADTGNGRVVRLDIRTGQPVGGLDSSAGVVRPISVSCDALNNVYITDSATNDVTRYTNFGLKAHALGEIRKLNSPQQTAVDGQGRIYLAEAGADRLHVFDASGNSLIALDKPMAKLGAFHAPSGVTLGPNGEIYLSDTLNHRVIRLAWE